MEKVKVSQKIADLIKNTKKMMPKHQIVEKHKKIGAIKRNEIDLDTLIRALYIGYEVDPEFKVGDWVFVNWLNKYPKRSVFKIVDFTEHGRMVIDNVGRNTEPNHEIVRHATAEEIAKEKERRSDRKLNVILSELNELEKSRLFQLLK